LVEAFHMVEYVPVDFAAVLGFALLRVTVNEKGVVAWDRWS